MFNSENSQAGVASGWATSGTYGKRSPSRQMVLYGQWALILIVSNILANVNLENWVIPAVIFIIGAHFLPLARVFVLQSHFITGAALMLLACVYPFVAVDGPISGTGPVFAGLILWLSASYAIWPVTGFKVGAK